MPIFKSADEKSYLRYSGKINVQRTRLRLIVWCWCECLYGLFAFGLTDSSTQDTRGFSRGRSSAFDM